MLGSVARVLLVVVIQPLYFVQTCNNCWLYTLKNIQLLLVQSFLYRALTLFFPFSSPNDRKSLILYCTLVTVSCARSAI